MGPGNISLLNWVIALTLAELLVRPVITLIHELGHAVVALTVSPGPVIVHVGRPSAAIGVLWGRLTVHWSPVPAQGVRSRGICVWGGQDASDLRRLAVSLAGPVATALLIPVFILATVECADLPQWIPATWGLSALGAFISCLVNFDPRSTKDAKQPASLAPRGDGPMALAAYRRWRAQRQRAAAP
jgi:hypothetical protein